MLSSKGLKEIVTTVRPIIERQLDDAEQIAAFRNKVAESGGDWSALKALIKAQIQDERDETGDGKRVKKILDKAGFSTDYAALLGWSNMNEKNFSAEEDYDRETGEILDKREAAVEKHGLAGALSAALGVEVEIVRVHETRSDLGLNILTKHEDIRTAPETAEEISRPAALAVPGGERSVPSLDAGGVKMDGANHPGRSDEVSGHRNAKSGQATNTNSEKATVATQGEATAPTSDERVSLPVDDRSDAAANAGGDDVESSAPRAGIETPTSNTGEGAACALPAKPKFVLRPYCRNPGETCGGSGTTHCHSCLKAREEVAA
ncbi:MAG: hypothetical protein LCH99_29435 [Proteobacteria bacterium]|nr:hypothetical protein [Pseudomonadota bacterium]